jgi:hypothetical protein
LKPGVMVAAAQATKVSPAPGALAHESRSARVRMSFTTTLPACSPNDQPRLWLATSWSADQGFNQHRDQLAPSSLKLCDFESEIHNEIHNEIFTEIVTEI